MYSYIKNVCWLPIPNKVELFFDTNPSIELEKVASVFVYAFDSNGSLLMISEKKDIWEIPGGGRDAGETIETTAKREVLEEAQVILSCIKPFAYQKLSVFGDKPEKYRRPYPESFEVFVTAKAENTLPFDGRAETIDRAFFTYAEATKQDGILFENRHVLFEKALKSLQPGAKT